MFIANFARPSFEPDYATKAIAADVTHTKQNALSVVTTTDKTADKTTENGLTANEKAILSLITANPTVTQKEMAVALSLSEDGVRYHTKKLKTKGLLRRQGGKKVGHWEIVRE